MDPQNLFPFLCVLSRFARQPYLAHLWDLNIFDYFTFYCFNLAAMGFYLLIVVTYFAWFYCHIENLVSCLNRTFGMKSRV